jgi:hypothetical protein
MIKTGLLTLALLMSGAMIASAQQAPPPQDNDDPGMMMAPDHAGMGQWGSHHPMMMQMMRTMGNRNPRFEIMLGHGVGVRVDCGRDTIKNCVDASMPLLDRANAMLDKMPKMPPPPPPPPPKPAGTTP